jgi:hypothetical protein
MTIKSNDAYYVARLESHLDRLWSVLDWINDFDPQTIDQAEAQFHFDREQRKIED